MKKVISTDKAPAAIGPVSYTHLCNLQCKPNIMKEIFYMRGDMLGKYDGSYFGRSGWSI